MGLDIFFLEDIRNALLAANEASTSKARVCAAVSGGGGGDVPSVRLDESPTRLYLQAYLEGYRAALTTVALAFGLSPDIIGSREPFVLPFDRLRTGGDPGSRNPDQSARSCCSVRKLSAELKFDAKRAKPFGLQLSASKEALSFQTGALAPDTICHRPLARRAMI